MLAEMLYDNIDSKTNIIVANITDNVLHPYAWLSLEKMVVNKIFSRMCNIGTDWNFSKVKNYQMGLSLN